MDDSSGSSHGLESPVPSAPSSASKQPTYTTAGTIYDPNSTQPLQPPARRGRSFKWSVATSGPHSDLVLFPKSMLANLPSNRIGIGSNLSGAGVSRYAPFQQYSPLQQNSDRAINPLDGTEIITATTDRQGGRIEARATPSVVLPLMPSSRFRMTAPVDDDTNKDDGTQVSVAAANDSDPTVDPLMHMPVKSLQNLASYPNPSQERAQEALQGGNKAVASNAGDNSGQEYLLTSQSRDYAFHEAPRNPHSVVEDQYDPRDFSQEEEPNFQQHAWSRDGFNAPKIKEDAHRGVPNMDGEGCDNQLSTATCGMTTAMGAPRPLTAGPPGQRQYQPSTFEATLRALQAQDEARRRANLTDIPMHQGGQVLDPGTLSDVVLRSSRPMSRSALQPTAKEFQPVSYENEWHPSADSHVPSRSVLGPVGSAADARIALPAEPCGAICDDSWRVTYTARALRDAPRAAAERVEKFRARQQRIDSLWYEASDWLSKTADDHISDLRRRQLRGGAFGAIGDGRPSKAKPSPPISVPEANRMTASQHAEPLVNMLFGSVLRAHAGDLDDEFLQSLSTAGRKSGDEMKMANGDDGLLNKALLQEMSNVNLDGRGNREDARRTGSQ